MGWESVILCTLVGDAPPVLYLSILPVIRGGATDFVQTHTRRQTNEQEVPDVAPPRGHHHHTVLVWPLRAAVGATIE